MIRTNAVGIQPLNSNHEINRKVQINEIRMADNLFILNAAEWYLRASDCDSAHARSTDAFVMIHNAFGSTASIKHCRDYCGTTMFNPLSKTRIILNLRRRNIDRNPDSCLFGRFFWTIHVKESVQKRIQRFIYHMRHHTVPDIMALHALMFYRHCFINYLLCSSCVNLLQPLFS